MNSWLPRTHNIIHIGNTTFVFWQQSLLPKIDLGVIFTLTLEHTVESKPDVILIIFLQASVYFFTEAPPSSNEWEKVVKCPNIGEQGILSENFWPRFSAPPDEPEHMGQTPWTLLFSAYMMEWVQPEIAFLRGRFSEKKKKKIIHVSVASKLPEESPKPDLLH